MWCRLLFLEKERFECTVLIQSKKFKLYIFNSFNENYVFLIVFGLFLLHSVFAFFFLFRREQPLHLLNRVWNNVVKRTVAIKALMKTLIEDFLSSLISTQAFLERGFLLWILQNPPYRDPYVIINITNTYDPNLCCEVFDRAVARKKLQPKRKTPKSAVWNLLKLSVWWKKKKKKKKSRTFGNFTEASASVRLILAAALVEWLSDQRLPLSCRVPVAEFLRFLFFHINLKATNFTLIKMKQVTNRKKPTMRESERGFREVMY